MPTSGATFTDWEQLEADRHRPLLVDEDFSWSEPPTRRRRSSGAVAVAERDYEPDYREQRVDQDRYGYEHDRGHAEERAYVYEDDLARDQVDDQGYAESWDYPRERAPKRPRGRRSERVRRSEEAWSDRIDVDREIENAFDSHLNASVAAQGYELVPPGFEHGSQEPTGRRTVVITGRGAERYGVHTRRQRDAELSFHERASFSPDRTAMWAVLLSLALLLGCIVH